MEQALIYIGKSNRLVVKQIILFHLLFSIFTSQVLAQEKVDGVIVNKNSLKTIGASSDYIHLYQDYLSPIKQGICAMYPSCSNYGLMVYKEYPFLVATTMLADRLMRCSHDQSLYPKTTVYGRTSCIDYPPRFVIPDSIKYSTIPLVHTDVLRFHTNDTLLFVNKLINAEDYQSAMYAIQKSEFENKGISAELEAKKLLCYRGLRKYEEGVFEYETQLNLPYKQSPRIGLQASLLYYSLDNNQSTINVLDNIISKEISDFFAIHSIRGIAQARLGNYDTAIEDFNTLSSLATNQYNESIQLLNELRMQHKKSKVMAEVLSIIPGLGYWYSGHPKSAITSLLVNCALGYATYTSIKTENYGVAGLCGFFAMSFYIGNITGAGKSAERYNIKKQQETIAKLEKINQIYLIN